ncbi:MAG: hypothetical protein DDT37_01912 [Firmicutes bacterium]|nr:hypothetical protein [candidate division NPL-UPA2 bacterium]
MNAETIIQGRRICDRELGLVRRLLCEHPDWHRTRLSRELCAAWDWRDDSGRIKDMACRTLLLKLEARGLVRLPARRRAPVNDARNRCLPQVEYSRSPIDAPLCSLLPLTIQVVDQGTKDMSLFKRLIAEHHYLGLRNTVGENLKYLIRDAHGRLLSCLLFGSAAWRCKDRDLFIEWDDSARRQNLSLLTNNTRFLVLPWVRVPNLASHVLSRIARRICRDWEEKYGHGVWALETFVDRARFTGACYQAANWRKVGRSTGRTRNDTLNRGPLSSVKDVYLYPLARQFRRRLCAVPCSRELSEDSL